MKKEINVILGVFYTDYWKEIKTNTNSLDYWDFDNNRLPVKPKWTGKGIDIDMLAPLTPVMTTFHFLLDTLYLPLNPSESVTCKELAYILSNKEALNKTQFWLKGRKIDKDKVLKVITTVKEAKLVFENLDLDTF